MVYDSIFLTHLPSFYKVNLYNEISMKKSIMVIFVGTNSEIRNNDFCSADFKFDFIFLNNGSFESRNVFISSLNMFRQLIFLKCRELIVGGWDLFEFWLPLLWFRKSKLSVIVESTVYDSNYNGLKGYVKRFFLRNVDRVYCSGTPHVELVKSLGFKGEIVKTGGVGIRNIVSNINNFQSKKMEFKGRFVYIGRLSVEKNVNFLVDFFTRLPELTLTLVGDGPLMSELKISAGKNIQFLGYVDNLELSAIMQDFDVFILPSSSETWGLVVEEAITFGLPVICSSKVGCGQDLVVSSGVGLLFDIDNENSLLECLSKIEENYKFFLDNVNNIDMQKFIKQQIESFQ